MKTHKGKLVFPDMTNNDVDNGRFDSEVRNLFIWFGFTLFYFILFVLMGAVVLSMELGW